MDERIKEKLINRAKTNPYVNFLGIDFTVIEEGRVEAHMPLHDEQRQYNGVTPFHVIPFAGKRQVKPDIYPRVLPQQPGGLGEPRGDNHNLYTGLHPILIPFHALYRGPFLHEGS